MGPTTSCEGRAMSHPIPSRMAHRRSHNAPRRAPGAGPRGIAIDPPAYGIAFVDQGRSAAGIHRGPGPAWLSGGSPARPVIQAKLEVNAPGDRFEEEADRI